MKEAIIAFTLSMPNCGSWNGKWTGEKDLYVITRKFGRTKEAHNKVNEIMKKPYHYYNFGDGWGAGVSLQVVDTKEATKLRKASNGFMGYNWMVDSIIKNNKIIVDK